MSKRILFYLVAIITAVNFYSCREEINSPPIESVAVEGAYLLSEGGFTPGSSKLSFYNLSGSSFIENIFNPATLGLLPDGLVYFDKQLYLTEQGNFPSPGKIYNLDSNGTIKQSQPVGNSPYSLAIANEKIYITNGPANNISVLNRNNLTAVTIINVGLYPQEIISIGNKIFVCNTSVFGGGTDSTVSVIDAVTDQVVANIVVRKKPSSLAVTNDGNLLVGCPGDAVEGIIYKINSNTYAKLDSFIISSGFAIGFDKDIAVSWNNEEIYFISSLNNIVKLNLSTKLHSVFIPNTNTAVNFFYGYNYDSRRQKHYVGNAKDFRSNGNFEIYDANGTNTNTFVAGLFPRRIVIKN
ncbi:MAG: YncE family protein [bacterium]